MLLSVAGIWIAFGVAGTTPFMWLREVLQQVVGSSRLEHVQDIRMHFIEMSALTILPTVHLQNVVRTWDGCKSAEHHQSEERKAEWTWLSECIRAWRWASSARKWVAIHRKPSYVYSAPLETPSEPVTWPLRGFELVRLNKRELDLVQAESFPHATCWIGRHRSSGESVAVFVGPAGVDPDEHVKHLERHLPDILKSREDRITRVIMVTDMPHPDPPTALFGRRMEWIDEGELLATLVDFRNYRADIRRRVESIPIANSTRTLRETYVPCAVNFGRSCSNVEEYLDSWLEEPGRRHVALLGEFGMGKSTTVLMWTYRWILSASFDGQRLPSHFRIPIIIELRGLSPRHNSPDALLASWAMRYQADPNAVRHLVAAGRVVLVLEGFDETAFQGNEDARIAHFRTLWKLAYPRAKLLFTGRPNFFVNPTERENALRLHQPRGDSPYCVAITLRCLSIRQIESALRDQDQRVREQIVARAKRYTRFRDLVSRPTLLHAVATMWEEHGLHGLPDEQLTSARVMRLFVRHSDLREGLKEEGDTPYQPVLTREERAYFMSGVACAMLARALPNQITGDELEQLIENLFDAMPEVISAPHQPLRERVGTDYEVRHGMHTDIRTTGLLVEDGAKAGAFKFAHKSYMEYLAAEQIASGMADALNASSGAIRFVTQIGIGNLRDQPDVMLFCAEALADLASGRAGSSGSVAKGLYAVFRGGWMTRTLRAGLFRRWIRQGLSNQRKLADPATLLLDNQIVVPIFGVLIVLSVAVVCVTLALVLGGPSERSSEGSIAVTIMVVSTATLSLFQSSLLERRVERIYQEFVLWVLACLRSGVSRPDIVSSLGISRDGVDCDLPILPVSTARIRKLVIRGFFDRSAVDLKTKGWRRCLLSTLPDPAELYLAKLPVDPRPAQTEVLKLSFRTGIISISLSTSTDTLAVADKAALRNLVYMLQGSSETVDRAEYIGSDPTTAISTQTEDPRQEDKEGGQ